RRAAIPQNVNSGERRLRMRRCHHAVLTMNGRTAGEMEIPHAKSLTLSLLLACSGRYMAYPCRAQQWSGVPAPMRELQGFHRNRPLIDRPYVLQGRRLLSI